MPTTPESYEAPEGVDLSGPDIPDEKPTYDSEDDEFLFGPTDRPDEAVVTGARARSAPPPEDLRQWLPALLDEARNPDAPEELHAFLRLVKSHLDDE